MKNIIIFATLFVAIFVFANTSVNSQSVDPDDQLGQTAVVANQNDGHYYPQPNSKRAMRKCGMTEERIPSDYIEVVLTAPLKVTKMRYCDPKTGIAQWTDHLLPLPGTTENRPIILGVGVRVYVDPKNPKHGVAAGCLNEYYGEEPKSEGKDSPPTVVNPPSRIICENADKGFVYDASFKECVLRPENRIVCETDKGFVYDQTLGTCVIRPKQAIICENADKGFVYDERLGQCVVTAKAANCVKGELWNTETRQCVKKGDGLVTKLVWAGAGAGAMYVACRVGNFCGNNPKVIEPAKVVLRPEQRPIIGGTPYRTEYTINGWSGAPTTGTGGSATSKPLAPSEPAHRGKQGKY